MSCDLPDAAKRYRKILADLRGTLQTDISPARQCLKTLLGSVRLVPSASGDHLEAELHHNPEGFLSLPLTRSSDESKTGQLTHSNIMGNSPFKARLVAGVVSLPDISTN